MHRNRQAARREAGSAFAAQGIEIDRAGGLRVVACEFGKLARQCVDIVQVADHGVAFSVVAYLHLDREAQAGERRTQIVRKPGEQQGAVCILFAEAGAHAVERLCQRGEFVGALFVEACGKIAAPDAAGDFGRCTQRPVDALYNGPAASESEQQGERPPADPLPGQTGRMGAARQHEPVGVGAECETDPQRFVVRRVGEQEGVFAQAGLQCLPDVALHGGFRWW